MKAPRWHVPTYPHYYYALGTVRCFLLLANDGGGDDHDEDMSLFLNRHLHKGVSSSRQSYFLLASLQLKLQKSRVFHGHHHPFNFSL